MMPKKTCSKAAVNVEDSAAVDEIKPPSVQKKRSSEIDEIFAGKKKKKENKEEEIDVKKSDTIENSRKLKKRKNSDRSTDKSSRSRKKTKDGLALYTEDELGINKADGGGTTLCPFDCSCCF